MAEFPIEFADRLKRIVGESRYDAVCGKLRTKTRTYARANSLQISMEGLVLELERVGLHPRVESLGDYRFLSFSQDERRALTETDAFYEGRIYIQNPSSQLAALALSPQDGEHVLDLAAAPGGKTLHIACLMGGKGSVTAVEAVKGRFYKLKANLQTHKAERVQPVLMDGRAAGKRWPSTFDRVLLDAPCSSEARFDLNDTSSWAHWTPRKIKETSRKQKRLILSAFDSLVIGGALLYCTCSFAPEENEAIVQSLMKRYPDRLAIEPIELELPNTMAGIVDWGKKPFTAELAKAVRILPDERFDGFFMCRMRKLS